MNKQITNNLYELWKHIGSLTTKLVETENYSTVSMDNSDWPNRIFDLKNNNNIFKEILKLCQEGKLPEIITIPKPNDLRNNSSFEFIFRQINMALDLKSMTNELSINPNIERVETEKDPIISFQISYIAICYLSIIKGLPYESC